MNQSSMQSMAHFPAWSVEARAQRRQYRFQRTAFLVQVLFCGLPPAILVAMGKASWAGYFFWGALGLVLLRDFALGRRDEALCVLVGLAPFINLLRGFAFYNVIIATFSIALLYYAMGSGGTIWNVFRRVPLALWIFILVTVYYLLSFFNTHEYSSNLRLYELALTLTCILILARNRLLLGSALIGLIVSAWAVGLGMLPHVGSGSRLGMIELEGRTLGNPTQLGIPLAFGFLALLIDHGRWLHLQASPGWRWTMLAITLPLLALTTSRSAWLVAVGGVLICALLGSRQRLKILVAMGLAAIAIQAVLLSPFSLSLRKGIERTFSESRNARQRTSGRSDQWQVAWHAGTQSLETIIRGYGAGNGPQVYANFSGDIPGVRYAVGKKVAFHSLFMQIAVETGSIGLLALLSWLCLALVVVAAQWRRSGLLLPLICLCGYLFIVLTVSGNDINSGIFLGMALAGAFALPARRSAVNFPLDHENAHNC